MSEWNSGLTTSHRRCREDFSSIRRATHLDAEQQLEAAEVRDIAFHALRFDHVLSVNPKKFKQLFKAIHKRHVAVGNGAITIHDGTIKPIACGVDSEDMHRIEQHPQLATCILPTHTGTL
jgi:hypothetical protein